MPPLNLLDADLDLGPGLNLDGLTVTHMRDSVAMQDVGEGPMAMVCSCTSSCSTSCSSITE